MPKKSDTEAALLAAILASPDDDLPRLVFADWCDENGDPDRAEFIRTEIEMAKMMPDWNTAPNDRDQPRYKPLGQRANALWYANIERWYPGMKRCAEEVNTQRGFPNHIATPVAKFITHAPTLFASAPTINGVALGEIEDQAAALAACPALAQIERLSFFETPFLADHARDFFRSPHLYRLREFDVGSSGTQMGEDGATALAACESLVRLEDLNLSEQNIGDNGAYAVLNQERFRTLREIDFSSNGLRDVVLQDMPRRTHFVNLRVLKLRSNHFTFIGMPNLYRAESLAGLEELDLSGNSLLITSNTLTTATFTGRLRKLSLQGCHLTQQDTATLFASRSFTRLEELNLSGSTLTSGSVWHLVRHDGFRALRELSVSECRVTGEVARVLARVDTLPNLRRLAIGRQPLGPNGFPKLLAGPLVRSLETLDVEKAHLGDDGAEVIATAEWPNLRNLCLSDNGITDAGARALTESKSLAGLRYLMLADNRLTDAGKAMVQERFGEDWCWV